MTGNVAMTGAATPTVVPVYMIASSTPLARFVRWQITGTVTWDATFRIVASANAPGLT
jgi:hypothetical protein